MKKGKCSLCKKDVGTFFSSAGLICTVCRFVFCRDCANAGLFGNGECPRCGGKTEVFE